MRTRWSLIASGDYSVEQLDRVADVDLALLDDFAVDAERQRLGGAHGASVAAQHVERGQVDLPGVRVTAGRKASANVAVPPDYGASDARRPAPPGVLFVS